MSKVDYQKLFDAVKDDEWFVECLDYSDIGYPVKICDECNEHKALGAFFPLTGEPIFDKNALDISLCKECLMASQIDRGYLL